MPPITRASLAATKKRRGSAGSSDSAASSPARHRSSSPSTVRRTSTQQQRPSQISFETMAANEQKENGEVATTSAVVDKQSQQSSEKSCPADTKPKVVLGKRQYVEPLEKRGNNMALYREIIAAGTTTFFSGWVWILIFISIGAIFSWFWRVVLILIWSTVLLPATVNWSGFLNSPLFTIWREYFSMSYVIEENLDPKTHYVLAEYPHGVVPWSQLVCASITDKLFPGMKVYAISSSTMFVFPLFKHFMSWIGCEPATAKNFLKLLKKGTTAVVVGGLAEMYTAFRKKEYLIAYRQGYVKIAVQSGSPIVPIYHFGVTQVLSALGSRESIVCTEAISRKTGFSFLNMYGRWFLPIPRKVPLMLVTGRSIAVKQMDRDAPGFKEEVERVHNLVNEELIRIYKEYRGVYSEEWKDRTLEIETAPGKVTKV